MGRSKGGAVAAADTCAVFGGDPEENDTVEKGEGDASG